MNWEYWPSKAFYYPVAPFIIWLMIRARHMCFFTAANPGIYTGGMGLESKYQTLQLLPEALRPKSVLIKTAMPFEEALAQIDAAGLSFPLVAKPDLGFRGLLVKKIADGEALRAYLGQYPIDFIVQELISLPEEVGLLYYRFPGQEKGQVSSITTKEFLTVRGDGRATVLELVHAYPRALLQLERIQKQYPHLLDTVPDIGEKVELGMVGNHAKGTRFINSNAAISDAIISAFDDISKKIDGFYYGRFDLKCASFDALQTGEGLKIIELNGVCSEPTHIYDPERGTYWSALRDIARHWTIIFRIARMNRKKGIRYESHARIAKAFLHLFAYQKKIRQLEAQDQLQPES
jgi:hypothetical protein